MVAFLTGLDRAAARPKPEMRELREEIRNMRRFGCRKSLAAAEHVFAFGPVGGPCAQQEVLAQVVSATEAGIAGGEKISIAFRDASRPGTVRPLTWLSF